MLYEGLWYWEDPEMWALIREGDIGLLPPPRWEDQASPIYRASVNGYLIPASVQNLAGSLIVLTCTQITRSGSVPSERDIRGLLDSGLPSECVDIYRQVLSADIAYGPLESNIFENPLEGWSPYEWMQYQAQLELRQNAHLLSFPKPSECLQSDLWLNRRPYGVI